MTGLFALPLVGTKTNMLSQRVAPPDLGHHVRIPSHSLPPWEAALSKVLRDPSPIVYLHTLEGAAALEELMGGLAPRIWDGESVPSCMGLFSCSSGSSHFIMNQTH